MIDIHTHVLFSVDDGCEDISQSIDMLKDAYFKGVTDIILTPHSNRKYQTKVDDIKEKFDILKAEIKKQNVPINLYLGQEIYVKFFSEEKLFIGDIISLNDTPYVLIEYPFIDQYEIVESVYDIHRKGLIPIVAHYEKYMTASIYEASEIKQAGGLIQIDADSFLPFNRAKKLVKGLLKEDLIDFIASDVHINRKNVIDYAYKYVVKKQGEKVAEKIFIKNAEKIIKG